MAFRVAFAAFWLCIAFGAESPLTTAGCAWMAIIEIRGVVRTLRATSVNRSALPADWRRANEAEFRLTMRDATPGVVLALAGWLMSAPGQWIDACAVAALWSAFGALALLGAAPKRIATSGSIATGL